MNWNEYKALAIRTESVPVIVYGSMLAGDDAEHMKTTRLLHATMGLATELAELVEGQGKVNFVEEVGDVLWYLAVADDVLGWQCADFNYFNTTPTHWIGELNDAMKRHIFYGKELETARLVQAFNCLYHDAIAALEDKGIPLHTAYVANIRKLEKRYPDKFFDAKAAIHRDVDRELDHIAQDGSLLPAVKTLELGEADDTGR